MFFPFGWTLSWEVQSQGSMSEENESQALKGRDSKCKGEHYSDGQLLGKPIVPSPTASSESPN